MVYTETHLNARKIKVKKGKRPPKDFLSQEELQGILKAIPSGNDLFLRHYVLLATLYDSGLRVQEICDLKLDDVSFGKNCTIKVFGKGQKKRIVYLSSDTASVIQSYCKRIQRTEGFLLVYIEIGSEAIIKAVNESAALLMTPDTINESQKWRNLDIMERIREKMS